MNRRSVIKKKVGVVALAMLCAALMFPAIARAQESHPPTPAATGAEQPKATEGSQADREVREAEAGDPVDALKHSRPVRWIAAKTGLSVNQAYWACIVLNFAVVFFALWIPLRKRLPGIFKNRTDNIRQRLEEARKTSEEARARLAEVENRLSRIDIEIAAMRREADENARSEEARIMAEAEEERRRIVAAAEQEISTAANAARRDLKAYAGELAVDLAAQRIQVGQDADQALVREFTSQLGKDGH